MDRHNETLNKDSIYYQFWYVTLRIPSTCDIIMLRERKECGMRQGANAYCFFNRGAVAKCLFWALVASRRPWTLLVDRCTVAEPEPTIVDIGVDVSATQCTGKNPDAEEPGPPPAVLTMRPSRRPQSVVPVTAKTHTHTHRHFIYSFCFNQKQMENYRFNLFRTKAW